MTVRSFHFGKWLFGAAATAGLLWMTLATFEGWVRHSADIFLVMVQNGVAWCF